MSSRKLHNDFPVSHHIVEHPSFRKLSIRTRLVYFYLVKHSNRYADCLGWFFRSIRDLKADTGIGQAAIEDSLAELSALQVIEIKPGQRGIRTFRVL